MIQVATEMAIVGETLRMMAEEGLLRGAMVMVTAVVAAVVLVVM